MALNKYSVVVVSQNSYSVDGSSIIERDCGHKHRSLEAAERCLHTLRSAGLPAGECRANWYHAQVRFADGSRIDAD